MSNLETRPEERVCSAARPTTTVHAPRSRSSSTGTSRSGHPGDAGAAHDPQRARSLVGAWCFLDHYGPDPLPAIGDGTDGMQVPPHPHTGLQTVTWLFAGEILHRDAVGSLQTVRPGELNLMTAGRGISHSEESPRGERPPVLHGVQLWVALPGDRLADPPAFEHHADLPVATVDGARVQVFLGALRVGGAALRSPATTFTPIVGAQLDLAPGARVTLDVDPAFEHGLLVDDGVVRLEARPSRRRRSGTSSPAARRSSSRRDRRPRPCGARGRRAVRRGHRHVVELRRPLARRRRARPRGLAGPARRHGDQGPNRGGTRYADGARDRRYGEVVVGTTAAPCLRPRCPTSDCARAPGPPLRRAGRSRQ